MLLLSNAARRGARVDDFPVAMKLQKGEERNIPELVMILSYLLPHHFQKPLKQIHVVQWPRGGFGVVLNG